MNAKELLHEITGAAKKSKYNAKPTRYKGRTYSSKIEAKRAQELDQLARLKDIITWSPQYIVRLTDHVEWKVDFFVLGFDHKNLLYPYLEETKGKITADYKVKLDLYKQYGTLDLHIKMRKGERWYTEIVVPEK
jgi:hypothetical protein